MTEPLASLTKRMADRIQSLEREADAALDADMARLCRDALLGDAEAFEACREALEASQAMEGT